MDFDKYFEELNDMANFKNFGEKKEGITNADGSRNWEANILFDNVKRLEQENAELKAENERLKQELATYGATGICETCTDKANKQADKYYKTLQEIKEITKIGMHCEGMGCDFMPKILDLITKAEEE